MCCYKTLHQNQEGYVVFCNVVLSLSIREFYSFETKIADYYIEYRDHPFPNLKTITIPSQSPNITLVYSPNDLLKLADILNKAKEKLMYQKLFVFNEN
jgi:hypothetical protein